MIETNYNPDVLSCLANLSNDEVFTPTFTSFYCCEHDDFHFNLWQESWGQPKPFYMAWNELIDVDKSL